MSIFGNPVKEKEFDDLSWTTLISLDRGCCLMMFKFPERLLLKIFQMDHFVREIYKQMAPEVHS